MSICERLAAYVSRASWDAVSPEAKGKLKQHVLDSLGCALGAIPSGFMAAIRSEQNSAAGSGPCSLIGGGDSTPERATFYNSALIRSLDFADTFLAPGEAVHPSDNLAALLAGAELAGASGADLLVALALGYHIQCRLAASGVPIQRKGFNGTLSLSISLAAGLSRVFGLSEIQTAHAIALCAAESIGLGAVRSSEHVSQWKNLAGAAVAFRCIHSVKLAHAGVTGPLDVFEAPSGLEDALGRHFGIDWDRESYDGILACSLKKYNADFYAQSCLEGLLQLRAEHQIRPEDVQGIHVDLFKAGFDSIGGAKSHRTKLVTAAEDAANSLPYLMAVGLLDGEISPEQFAPSRIQSEDVQALLQRVVCWLSLAYTRDYPQSLRCKVRIGLKDGQIFEIDKDSYDGFFRSPMPVESLLTKFKQLGRRSASDDQLQRIIESVARLEHLSVSNLANQLRDLKPDQEVLAQQQTQAVTA